MTLNNYHPKEWAALARQAGMKYFVVTAKHHDGFGMVDFPGLELDIANKFIQTRIYSSLTLVLAICEGSHISPKNKFSSFLTLYIVPHIPKASGICEKKFRRFSFKNL